jgi:hypothetical protein
MRVPSTVLTALLGGATAASLFGPAAAVSANASPLAADAQRGSTASSQAQSGSLRRLVERTSYCDVETTTGRAFTRCDTTVRLDPGEVLRITVNKSSEENNVEVEAVSGTFRHRRWISGTGKTWSEVRNRSQRSRTIILYVRPANLDGGRVVLTLTVQRLRH